LPHGLGAMSAIPAGLRFGVVAVPALVASAFVLAREGGTESLRSP
jgi:hypothetical protein